MSDVGFLDAENAWVDSAFDAIYFAHRKIRLVDLPYSGKTQMLIAIREKLRENCESPESVIWLDGKGLSQNTAKDILDAATRQIDDAVVKYGEAFLIFDHFGDAMMQPRAAYIQAKLFSSAINHPKAEDIGCLVAHRLSQRCEANVASSPFVGRLEVFDPPRLEAVDLDLIGVDLMSRAGSVPGFVRAASDRNLRYSPRKWSLFLDSVCRSWAYDLPGGAAEILSAGSVSDVDLANEVLKSFTVPGSTDLIPEIRDRLIAEVMNLVGRWPNGVAESCARMCSLISKIGASYWYDRYLLSPDLLDRAKVFFSALDSILPAPIRLLVSRIPDWDSARVNEYLDYLEGLTNVSVRLIETGAARRFHDRHLVSVVDGHGFALPEGREVLGVRTGGNGMESRLVSPVDYSVWWKSATRVNG